MARPFLHMMDSASDSLRDRKRILFVDDDPLILASIGDLLHRRKAVWELVFTSSPIDALKRLQSEPFDVVVADMWMPALDGVKLLDHVRVAYPNAGRVLLTGKTSGPVSALESKNCEVLLKPCPPSQLIRAIAQALVESSTDSGPLVPWAHPTVPAQSRLPRS